MSGRALRALAPSPPLPPLAPPPPLPPLAPQIPHLILGSLRYTLAWDLVASAVLLAAWFAWRVTTYGAYPPAAAAPGGGPSSSPRRQGRVARLLAVWRASDEEVTARCGADARDYLVVQRRLLVAVLAAAVPGLCILLPVALYAAPPAPSTPLPPTTSSSTTTYDWVASRGSLDESSFARTTVHHLPNRSPALWAVVLTSAVTIVAVETVADVLSQTLVRERYASAELVASVAGVSVLLRRCPRRVTDDPDALRRAFDARFPGRVHAAVVPRDGNEARLVANARRLRRRLRVERRRQRRAAAQGEAAAAARAAAAAARTRTPPRAESGDGLLLEGREDFSVAAASAASPINAAHGSSSSANAAPGSSSIASLARKCASAESALASYRDGTAGVRKPSPGCAFIVFKDPITARRALEATKPTLRGAVVGAVANAGLLPHAWARALAPGYWGGEGHPSGGGGYYHERRRRRRRRRRRTSAVVSTRRRRSMEKEKEGGEV